MNIFKKVTVSIVITTLLTFMILTASASTGDTNVTFKAGQVSISAFSIDSFGQVTLTGLDQTIQTNISNFSITDARGNAKGWTVQISATRFANGTNQLHDGSLSITGMKGSSVGFSDPFNASYINDGYRITQVPGNYIVVPTSKGKGTYTFTDGKLNMDIWPSEVMAGTYTTTLTIDAVPNM